MDGNDYVIVDGYRKTCVPVPLEGLGPRGRLLIIIAIIAIINIIATTQVSNVVVVIVLTGV